MRDPEKRVKKQPADVRQAEGIFARGAGSCNHGDFNSRPSLVVAETHYSTNRYRATTLSGSVIVGILVIQSSKDKTHEARRMY
jgi:hypothetical protein